MNANNLKAQIKEGSLSFKINSFLYTLFRLKSDLILCIRLFLMKGNMTQLP